MAERLPRDQNRIPVLGGVSPVDDTTVIPIRGDATTKGLHVHLVGSDNTSLLGSVKITDGTETLAINTSGRAEVDLEESSLDLMLGTDFSNVFGTASLISATPAVNVEALSVIPGTGASNLGKAEDGDHTSGDVGVMALAVFKSEPSQLAASDGKYAPFISDGFGRIYSNVEHDTALDSMNATTDWAVLGNDTVNLATTLNHIHGTAALKFDKANGDDNTIFAGIEKTITSVDATDHTNHGVIQVPFYVSSIAQVAYVFIRIGTSSSHYNEWRIDDDDITAGIWSPGSVNISSPDVNGSTGNGWNPAAVTYIAVGVAFDNQINTLEDIRFDELALHTSLHTLASLSSEVSSSVSTPNVRLQSYGNAVDTNSGNVSSQTLRTVLATDQPAVAVTESSPISGFATSAGQLADGHNVTVDNAAGAGVYIRPGTSASFDVNLQDGAGTDLTSTLVGADQSLDVNITQSVGLAVTESSPISGFATSAGQLADGHNVTVDNAAGAAAVNIQDGGNTITVDGTVSSNATLQAGSAAVGKVNHDISGIGDGVKTVTTAGTDEVLAGSTVCKKVVIQAQTDNTGLIAVGASGVDATVATGTGVGLTVGDYIVLQIDNLADIFIDATVSGEGVRYTYFT